eukprot:100342-Prymnesium_polylepis.1
MAGASVGVICFCRADITIMRVADTLSRPAPLNAGPSRLTAGTSAEGKHIDAGHVVQVGWADRLAGR